MLPSYRAMQDQTKEGKVEATSPIALMKVGIAEAGEIRMTDKVEPAPRAEAVFKAVVPCSHKLSKRATTRLPRATTRFPRLSPNGSRMNLYPTLKFSQDQ
jgi:hypothetical protein